MPTARTEELASQGALVTERQEMGPVVPPARREKYGVEPRAFFDISDSTKWEAVEGGPQWDSSTRQGGRRGLMLATYRAHVAKLEGLDTEAAAEQAAGKSDMGGILTFGFGPGSTDGHDVNSANFDEIFGRADMQPGGGTHIAGAFSKAAAEFDEEFGDKDPEQQPVMLDLIYTDGELDDLDKAEAFIRSASSKHVILVSVFGYDESGGGDRHTRTLTQWGRIAQELQTNDPHGHQYLFVVPMDNTTDPSDLARDAELSVA